MLTFSYEAKDIKTGKTTKGHVQAQSEAAAAKLLLDQGFSPLNVKPIGTDKGVLGAIRNRVSLKDKVIFSRQLATLINAGLPLAQSLRTVQEQIDNKFFSIVISEVITEVEGGSPLAKALDRHPRIFNNVFTSLVAAGETSGTLDEALERIANQQEKDAELIAKVRGALVYPAIVVFVIIGVVVFMLTTVLPQVKLLYDDLNQELPFITSILLKMSEFITEYWWIAIFIVAASIFLLARWAQTEGGRSVLDKLKMSVPLFGRLFKKVYMARFCRTGATLMNTGVPMLEMLRITGQSVNNVHVEGSVMKAAEKVKGGKALSETLKGDENFLSLVPQMIRIGEQSGAIDAMMSKAASFYENEVDNEVKAIATTIEPVLMVVLAIVAGLMVAAILFPVYGLVGQNIT